MTIEEKFESLLKDDRCQVFLFTCPATLPFGWFARHPWLVVNRNGILSRWEIFWRPQEWETSWGHLHENFYAPTEGIAKYFFSEKYLWKRGIRLLGLIEGETAERMADFIEHSPQSYPHCSRYSLKGPNSNTYVAWVLGNFPDSGLRLPWNSFGKGYLRPTAFRRMPAILFVASVAAIAIGGYFLWTGQSAPPSSQKEKPGVSAIVSFTEHGSDSWPFEWHITLSPADTQSNEFRIVSELRAGKPAGIEYMRGFDQDILRDILADAREIQPAPGDPVNMKFRLAASSQANASGPRQYEYLSLPAGFSRLGGFAGGNASASVRPYGTSFSIYMLGNEIAERRFFNTVISGEIKCS